MGQGQSIQGPRLVEEFTWANSAGVPPNVGEILPESERTQNKSAQRSVHVFTPLKNIFIINECYDRILVDEYVISPEENGNIAERKLGIQPLGSPNKRAKQEEGGNSMVEQEKRKRGQMFNFSFAKDKLVNKFCNIFYVGDSTCLVSVPEIGLHLLDFETGIVTDIRKPEFYGFFRGLTNKGYLVFGQQRVVSKQTESRTDNNAAFVLEIDSDQHKLFDPNSTLESNIDVIRESRAYDRVREIVGSRPVNGYTDVDAIHLVSQLSKRAGCSTVRGDRGDVPIEKWLVDILYPEVKQNKPSDIPKDDSIQFDSMLFPTEGGHCVTNEVVDDISYQTTASNWTKVMIEAGILPEGSATVQASAVLRGQTQTRNDSDKIFAKFLDSALCIKNDCRELFKSRLGVGQKITQELIDLITDMFVALNKYDIPEVVKFALRFDSFKELWASMTLSERKELIDGMKLALAEGVYTTDWGAIKHEKLVADNIWTAMEPPAWYYHTSGKASQAGHKLIGITTDMRSEKLAHILCLSDKAKAEKNCRWRDYEKIIAGVSHVGNDGMIDENLATVLNPSLLDEDESDRTCSSVFARRLANFIKDHAEITAMDASVRSRAMEKMRLSLSFEESTDALLEKIGGPEPAAYTTPKLDMIQASDEVLSVGFSPDGKRIVSGSFDANIQIWDAETGECKHTLKGHSKRVLSVGFSPDGKRIVSGSYDNSIRIWDAETGECKHTLKGHSGSVLSVGYSPDGKRIVSGSDDKSIRIWDAETGECKLTLQTDSAGISCSFSPDGKRIVSGSFDADIHIWDAETGECKHTLEGHSDWVISVCYSPDGKRIVSASGSDDGSIRIWDAETGECKHMLYGHSGDIASVGFSPDGKLIVSGADSVRIWDAETGGGKQTLKGYSHRITSVGFSPDGKRVVSGSYDKSIRIWDVL